MQEIEATGSQRLLTPPSPIARRKLGEQVLEQLLLMIESGAVKPGDALPSERDLMATYGVGRPAVREALQALQSRGWWRLAWRKGACSGAYPGIDVRANRAQRPPSAEHFAPDA